MTTYVANAAEALAARKWWVVDATGLPLGRLASRVATILRGKNKAIFSPFMDTGDFVIVVNANKVKLTGRKAEQKIYYRHSRYPGSLKQEPFESLVQHAPEVPIQQAVKRMLPKNVLGRTLLGKLKIYPTADHPHSAQQPQQLQLKTA
ncbi:MAG: 50S ribosomal protein L13 [Polyangiaceae bacterium]|nr:50S ribosomal protein L13 [Polyangiaceae bacterium]